MNSSPGDRWRRLLAPLWLGALLAVALIAAPASFATLAAGQAGPVVGRMLAGEAYTSLLLGVLLVLIERWRARVGSGSALSPELLLTLGAIFCTVAGHFALHPLIEQARAGTGRLGFATLHALSVGLFGLKAALVAALAWRATAAV